MIRLLTGDCRDVLKTLPDASVQCVVTSPPYYGLRDYGTAQWDGGDAGCEHIAGPRPRRLGCIACGVSMNEFTEGCAHCKDRHLKRSIHGTSEQEYLERDPSRPDLPNPPASWAERDATVRRAGVKCHKCGARRIDRQLGLEPTPEAYLATMVQVFREVRRVLRDDGTCWVNLGSSYSSGKGSNVADQLNRLLEGGSVFFAHPSACRIAAHGVDVALQDERSPNGILTSLFAAQRVDSEQGGQDFGKVIDLFAGPGRRCFGLPGTGGVIAEPADAKVGVDEHQHGAIVGTQLDAQSEAIFAVARIGSGSGEDDETALTIDQPGKPRIGGGIRWHSVWDTFAHDALLKGAEDVHLVDQAIALGDRPQTLAGLLCDFRVAKASEKQITLASIHGGLSLAVSDVRQLWFVLRCGSVVPYSRLYADASRFANALLPKQDLGMPWRLARALQEDGWILRSPIIWAKPNPMPESVTDRPTSAHEHVFLLTKRSRYYYDNEAVREERTDAAIEHERRYTDLERHTRKEVAERNDTGQSFGQAGFKNGTASRNLRNVWTIATAPFPAAHFATFPPELAERCIRAGSRPGDTVLDPFSGAGTALLVADRLGRDAIGIDLSHAYVEMARERLQADCPLFADISNVPVPEHPEDERMADLFAEAAE